jgi:tetratricopeptide (TPR) repeat protein
MRFGLRGLACVCISLVVSPAALGTRQDEPVPVEPADLAKRVDLVGKKVQVDDHKAYYLSRTGDDPDELQLKRTKITFLVPRKLRPEDTSRITGTVVRGVLRRDGARLVCDVTELRSVGGDLERLETGVKNLSAKDSETRKQWARWAERRARDFKNDTLLRRARELEAEAFRIETTSNRSVVDAPKEWLAMARDARRRKVPEPEPAALAHRALRSTLAAAGGAAELEAVIREIEEFFPRAANEPDAGRANVARWEAYYAKDPAAAYREATDSARRAFDRRLWADANERLLVAQATGDIHSALELAETATTRLPEKKDLASRLIEKAVAQAKDNLGSLRQSELKELADVLRNRLNRAEDAIAVTRQWLEVRKNRLTDTDALAPLNLAILYEEMLGDTVTSVELLRKAWRIDPSSKEIAEAFVSRGYRKVRNEWVASVPGAEEAGREARPEAGRSKGLTGMTPEEVRQRMGGKPNQVCYLGSQGQLIEQWIYLDTQGVRYVNLLHSPGELKPRVVAFYTLPPTKVKGGLGRSR